MIEGMAMREREHWRKTIKDLKEKNRAIILAHYYQLPEIQEVADFVGDSFNLAQKATQTDAEVIAFCGVLFMAESAKILNPAKTVLLPDEKAGCPMADMLDAKGLRDLKSRHKGAVVISYVNSSAEVKAESDLCCTSANAVGVVESIPPEKEIIFGPDRNLGAYIERQTGRGMIIWPGCCPIHDELEPSDIVACLQEHPGAKVVVHPECRPEITLKADAVCSTGKILEYVKNSPDKKFIIGTEEGFLYTLKKNCPDKEFYLARNGFCCPDMKLVTLPLLADCLEKGRFEVEVPETIREKAYGALQRMLSIRP